MKFIGFNGYIIIIFHEHNLCSNSKWKIVPNPFFTKFENVHKFVMSCDLTSFKHMENLLNTIIELSEGLKKGLHNMLNNLLI